MPTPQELRQKNLAELQRLLEEKRKQLLQLKFDLAKGKLKNTAQIGQVKKEVARILTIINENKKRETGEEENKKDKKSNV